MRTDFERPWSCGRMALLERLRRRQPTLLTRGQLDFWEEQGFLILPGFFNEDEVDAVNECVDRLWDRRREVVEPVVLDYLLETTAAGRSFLRDSPDDVRDWPYKLNDLYLAADPVLAMSAGAALSAILGVLLD